MSDFLARLRGQWQGTATTWFEPGPGFEDDWTVQFRGLKDGSSFVLQEYSMAVQGAPHAGWALFGADDKGVLTIAWADTFHTSGSGVMTSTGTIDANGVLSVLGSFQAGEERWGWRTELQFEGETLVQRAFNISPGGQVYPAIELRLDLQP